MNYIHADLEVGSRQVRYRCPVKVCRAPKLRIEGPRSSFVQTVLCDARRHLDANRSLPRMVEESAQVLGDDLTWHDEALAAAPAARATGGSG